LSIVLFFRLSKSNLITEIDKSFLYFFSEPKT